MLDKPSRTLDALFSPSSIAILGASGDPMKIGGRPLKFLKGHGFQGRLYPINPKHPEVQGVAAYAAVGDLPERVDHAIIALPQRAVRDAVAQCAEAGVRSATIFGSGFAEIGANGRAEQERIADIAAASGMRLLGPNCMGFMNFNTGVIASFAFMVELGLPPLGRTALVSQSGAFGGQALVMANERGVALGNWVTTGNECDIELADCIAHFARDEATDVILGYMEGCKSPDRLVAALELAADAGKPVVMVKAGRSDAGARAVASHTGAMAGNDRVFDALFERYGVHRADSIESFFDIAYALSRAAPPSGDRLGVFTVSGGVGILAADAAEENGLTLPSLPEVAQAELSGLLPHAAVGNPVDGTAQVWADMGVFETFLRRMAEGDVFDAFLFFFTAMPHAPHLQTPLLQALSRLKPLVADRIAVVSMSAPAAFRKEVEALGYLLFEDTSRAIRTIAALRRLKAGHARASAGHERAAALPIAALEHARTEAELKAALASAGLNSPAETIAEDLDAAQAAAVRIGFPVALKVLSPDILHKSDVGGVVLNIADPTALTATWQAMMDRVAAAAPDARIDGALISQMAPDGVDMIAGIKRDPLFGPVLLAGLGGIATELYRDVALLLAPISRDEARAMIGGLTCVPLLTGFRNAPAADIDALSEALVTLSAIAAGLPDDVDSFEINPLRVLPAGQGVLALDAAIVRRAEI